VVTAPEADVLADPRSGAVILLKVVKGDLLPLQGQLGDWYSVAAGEVTGWVRRESAALLFHPEFLDPARLRESYTPPPFVPHVPWGYWEYPGYSGYPGHPGYPGWWGRGIMPYPWRDPLSWGFWLYEGNRHDDHHDDHGHSGGGYRNRHPDPHPDRPPPPRDPRPR
jgi:hypothetical protein